MTLEVKNLNLKSYWPQLINSGLSPPNPGPWAGGLTALNLSFLVCLLGIHLALISKNNTLKFS